MVELAIYTGLGLGIGGYLLNKSGKQSRRRPENTEKTQSEILENKKSGNNNIYDSGYFQKVREMEDERVIPNFEKSFDPINTNVIPYFFNTLNETQVKRVTNPKHDPNLFQRELTKVLQQTPIVLSRLEPTPNDLTDVNQDNAVETGGWNGSPPKGLYAETELNRGWSQLVTRPSSNRGDGNRDGTTVPLMHNNMVPFFGGSARQNMDIDNRMLEGKLENFTGQFKLDQDHKIEVAPLFAPVQQNLDQVMEPRELDRYVSSLQIRHNELPFEQVHVGRGLNDGYTARPSGGFHNPIRIRPKTIDEQFVNPKVVREGRVIRGKATVDQRTAQQKQFKYRPELLVTNFHGERNFTTTGVQIKPTVRSGIIQPPTNRQHSKKIIGHANTQSGSQRTPLYLSPKGKISTKTTLRNTPFRNAVKAEAKKSHNNQQLRFENRANERSTTQLLYARNGHSHINRKFESGLGSVYQQDPARTTRNETYVVASNPSGFAQPTTQKGPVYNPLNQTNTTIRETTENNSHLGHLQTLPKGQVYDLQSVARTTTKETTEDNSYHGSVQTETIKGPVYDPFDVPQTTIRETMENNYHQGSVNTMLVKGQVYDPSSIMRTTVRETMEDNTHQGMVGVMSMKGQTYDPRSIMRTTVRETTEDHSHTGSMQSSIQKGQVYDPQSIAKTTTKETTENNYHNGTVGNTLSKGCVYDPQSVARTTIKETTENHQQLGPIGQSNGLKGCVYDPQSVMKTTIRETTEQDDHFGGGGQSSNLRSITYDPSSIARMTIKETTEDDDHIGGVGQSVRMRQIVYDPFDCAPTTHRETTEDCDYINGVQSSPLQNGNGYQTAPTDVKNTQRQFYSQFYHVNPMGQADAPPNQQLYDAVYNMHQNPVKEVISEGRAPTQVGMALTTGKVGVNIEVKKLENDRVNHYSVAREPIVANQRKPMSVCELTSFKNNLPTINTYFDPSVLKPFVENPLAQSVHSWA